MALELLQGQVGAQVLVQQTNSVRETHRIKAWVCLVVVLENLPLDLEPLPPSEMQVLRAVDFCPRPIVTLLLWVGEVIRAVVLLATNLELEVPLLGIHNRRLEL